MNKAAERLRADLYLMRWPEAMHPEFEYRGMADFVIRHGEAFPARTLDGLWEPMAPKQCFMNAHAMATCFDLEYAEGFATTGILGGLPVHHAWNLDEDGHVIDVTWADELTAKAVYLGVRFPHSLSRGTSVLDDWENRWPILKEKWEPSEARAP